MSNPWNKVLVFFAAMQFAAVATAQSPAQRLFVDSNDDWIAFQSGTLILDRTGGGDGPLFSEFAGPAVFLSASDLQTDVEIGFLGEMAILLTEEWALSGRYFEVDEFSESVSATGTPNLVIPGSPFQQLIDDFDAGLTSELMSLELLAHRRINDEINLFGGVRYLSVDESFSSDLTVIIPTSDAFMASVDNDLVGFQFGTELQLYQDEFFELGLTGSAGIYNNHREINVSEQLSPATANAESDDVAFVGELVFRGAARLTDRWSLIADYHLLWVDGVSTVTDQLLGRNFNANLIGPAPPEITVDDSTLFYHGVLLALRYEF